MFNLIALWAVVSLATFLLIGLVARVKEEPIGTWDGHTWFGIICFSILFPIGWLFALCFYLSDSGLWKQLTKER